MRPLLSLNTLLSRLYLSGRTEHADAMARTAVEIQNLPTLGKREWRA